MKDTKKRLEKHYLWHIRRINKKLDVFPKWYLRQNKENHELTLEQFNRIKKEVEDGGGQMDNEYTFLMNAREGFVQKLVRLRGDDEQEKLSRVG
ncbi:MAG: hypothetical protein IKZ86_09665 [Spirochaetaceae bacterium]|nr:hypothetical protein [Spirochaetaceae bacterium]